MNFLDLAKSSPMYEYWNSSQSDQEESIRLKKANHKSPMVTLFKEEPYKWEQLYQSIIFEIWKGDKSSIKGFVLLLGTVNPIIGEESINFLVKNNIFDNNVIKIIRDPVTLKNDTSRNYLRFLRILYAIFTNFAGIEFKRDRIHSYEITGAFCYKIKHIFDN